MRSWVLVTYKEMLAVDRSVLARFKAIERSGGRLCAASSRDPVTGDCRVEIDIPEDPTGLLM